MEEEKETLMGVNRSIAEENIVQEPRMIELKANINEMAEKGKALVAQVQEKITEYSKFFIVASLTIALALPYFRATAY